MRIWWKEIKAWRKHLNCFCSLRTEETQKAWTKAKSNFSSCEHQTTNEDVWAQQARSCIQWWEFIWFVEHEQLFLRKITVVSASCGLVSQSRSLPLWFLSPKEERRMSNVDVQLECEVFSGGNLEYFHEITLTSERKALGWNAFLGDPSLVARNLPVHDSPAAARLNSCGRLQFTKTILPTKEQKWPEQICSRFIALLGAFSKCCDPTCAAQNPIGSETPVSDADVAWCLTSSAEKQRATFWQSISNITQVNSHVKLAGYMLWEIKPHAEQNAVWAIFGHSGNGMWLQELRATQATLFLLKTVRFSCDKYVDRGGYSTRCLFQSKHENSVIQIDTCRLINVHVLRQIAEQEHKDALQHLFIQGVGRTVVSCWGSSAGSWPSWGFNWR